MQGILQISIYHSHSKVFNVENELRNELKNHPTSKIIEVGKNKSVHFGLQLKENEMFRYDWILGNKSLKLYCTLLLNQNQSEKILDESYLEAHNILATLEFK